MRELPLAEVIAEIGAELLEDDVGLWVIARMLRNRSSELGGTDVRLLAAQVCRALLHDGASLGQLASDGSFDEWPSISSVDRMLIEWSDLGRDPDIGEVAWLRRQVADE